MSNTLKSLTRTEIISSLAKTSFVEGYKIGLLEIAKDLCYWGCEKQGPPTFSDTYKMWVHPGDNPRCDAEAVYDRLRKDNLI